MRNRMPGRQVAVYTESETLFFAELEKTVPCGKTVYFILDLTPSAYTSEDGLTQPAK